MFLCKSMQGMSEYKLISRVILISSFSNTVLGPLRVKVREKGENNFKLIHIEQLSVNALKEAISKRLNKENPISEIKLIPDVLIELDDDVLQLDDMASLEVTFQTR